MLELTEKQHAIQARFLKYIQSQYGIEKVSQKLKRWSENDFAVFSRELNTAIKKASGPKLSKSDELEWMDVFETKKAEVVDLQTQITRTDNEIDQLVYALYGLTPEEIEIVEQAVN